MKNKNADGPVADQAESGSSDGKLADELSQATPADVAAFIAASLFEMRKLAVTFQMKFLVYLLEMAYQEAEIQAENGGAKEP